MRLVDLFEAPLNDIQLHGDWSDDKTNLPPIFPNGVNGPGDKENSFVSRVDRALVRDTATQDALRRIFAKFNMPVYLYFLNSKDAWAFYDNLDYGWLDNSSNERRRDSLWGALPEQLVKTVEARRAEKSIQVILAHNEGGEKRHPLTPWTIVHRMGHALMGENLPKDWLEANTWLSKKIEKTIFDHYMGPSTISNTDVGEFLRSICTFRSARENNALLILGSDTSYWELYVELFVSYIVQGRVRFADPPGYFRMKGDVSPRYVLQQGAEEAVAKEVEEMARHMNAAYAKLLRQACGKVFVC